MTVERKITLFEGEISASGSPFLADKLVDVVAKLSVFLLAVPREYHEAVTLSIIGWAEGHTEVEIAYRRPETADETAGRIHDQSVWALSVAELARATDLAVLARLRARYPNA